MSDHRRNAESLLARARGAREVQSWQFAQSLALAAQAEAMLEVAEQQRAANIIALGQYHIAGDLPPFRSLVMDPCGPDDVEPSEALREALDLEPVRREPRSDRDRAWDGGLDGGRLG